MKRMFALLAAVSVAVVPAALAQDSSPNRTYYLDEITVTAPPIIEGNSVTPYADVVSTVSDRQIDGLNALDLPSALRRVPGVTISRYNFIGNYGGGDGGAVFIRGQGSGRPGAEISMMFDGIPRFSGVWTHPLMDMTSIDFADRIEIHKSTQPVMNGNMSFGSVNIIPKRITQEGFITRFHSSLGSYSTGIGELEHGGKVGKLDYYLTLNRKQSNGQRKNADGQVQGVYGRVGYALNKIWDASFQMIYNDSWARDPLPLNTPPLPKTQKFDNHSALSILSLAHQQGIFSGTVKAYYDDGYIDWLQWSTSSNEEEHGITTFDNYGLRIKETMHLTNTSEIVAGLDADSYGGSSVSKRPSIIGLKTTETLSNVAPYVMISQVFGDNIQLIPSAGVRYNISDEFGNQAGWQVGQVVRMERSELHANYAHAFNLPGVWTKIFYRDYWSFAHNPNGWKKLEPEYLDHFEIGGAIKPIDMVSLDLTYYHDHVSDALRIVLPPPPPPSIQNIGDYTTQGLEATADIRPFRNCATFLGISLMSATPDEVPNAPSTSLTAGVEYTLLDKIRLNADAQHVSDQYVQGTRSQSALVKVNAYSLLNCRAGYIVPVGVTMGEIYIALENITNQTYEFRPGYPMPGRTIMAGIDVKM